MAGISDLRAGARSLSIELWPPRSPEAEQRLDRVLADLEPLHPTFASITYGAGGSTRERTHQLVVRLQQRGAITPMAHLACAGHSRSELARILERYRDAGVENILAIRGDPPLDAVAPAGSSSVIEQGELVHAIELVELAKEVGPFRVAVAAHPEGHPDSPDLVTDRRYLAEKLKVADFGITQFFFQVEEYLRLVEGLQRLGVDKPLLPGIMPITKFSTVTRMAELSGTKVPASVADRVAAVADRPEEVRRIGVEVAIELGAKLLAEGVPGLHLYTMNQSAATLEIAEALKLGNSGELGNSGSRRGS
ncbi:MAG: methylenetetrahydrofolate reductase [Acidimicrobiales bacterium]